MRGRAAAWLIAVALCVGLQAAGPWQSRAVQAAAVANTWTTDRSVAYQNDTGHSGAQPNDSLTPPLIKKWSVTFGAPVSFPLIAEGKVFVTVGAMLYVLDQATGSALWSVSLGGTRPRTHAAYDNGQVFGINYDGLLKAFNAATGTLAWSVQLPGQYAFSSPPTAFGGLIFVSGAGVGGTLYAVNETDGSVLWMTMVFNGDQSSPAVSTTGIYVSYACPNIYDFAPLTGALIWHPASGCSGGGGKTPVLAGGSLYVRDFNGNQILNAQNGTSQGTFTATPAPTIWGSTRYSLFGSTLTAFGTYNWTFGGDGTLVTAPLVVNGVVYVAGTSGNLYALNATTGVQIGSTNAVGAGVQAPDEQSAAQSLTGLGAGLGWLDVPAGNQLVAYTSALNISPGDLAFGMQPTGVPSAAAPVTITNYGGVADTVSGIATSGDFSQTNNCTVPLITGASCTVNVVFTPTVGGVRTGSLTFSDSSVGAHTVALSGNQVQGFPPSPPRNLGAVPGRNSVQLSWSPPLFTGGSPITGYVVTQTPGGTTNLGPSTTSLSIGGLSVGVTYSFQVVTVTANATSSPASASALVRFGAPGVILTVGGSVGSGTATALGQFPYSLAVAGTHVYIGDLANPVVRDLDTGNGQESALAGNDGSGYTGDGGPATSAMIHGAGAIVNCGPGLKFFADTYNYVIRRIDVSGNITTVAGTGQRGYSGDGGPATSAQLGRVFGLACRSGGGLYISDSGNRRVRILDASGNITTWWYGFSFPTGIVELGAMDVAAVSDAGLDNAVVKLTNGAASVVAGTPGFAGYGGDGGPANTSYVSDPRGLAFSTASGKLFIADRGNNRVRQVDSAGIINTIAWSGLNGPSDVSVDNNLLYVADGGNFLVRKIDLLNFGMTTVAGNGTPSLSGDGGQSTAAQLGNPYAVAVDAAGNQYIADNQNAVVRKIDTAGVITTVAGNGVAGFSGDGQLATSAQLKDPRGVAIGPNGDIFISDTGNQRIRKVDAVSRAITTIVGNGFPGFGGDGGLGLYAQINYPRAVSVDGSGNLYIADTVNNRVRKVTVDGIISTYAGTGVAGYGGDGSQASAAMLNGPRGLAFDGAGNLHISDTDNNRVRRVVTATGVISTVAGNGSAALAGDGLAASQAALNFPFGLGFDGAGNLYVADTRNQRIRLIDTNGNIFSVVGTCGIVAGFSGDGGPALTARVNSPYGVAVDSSNNLYIADVSNNRVRATSGLAVVREGSCQSTSAPAPTRDSTSPSGFASPPIRRMPDQSKPRTPLSDQAVAEGSTTGHFDLKLTWSARPAVAQRAALAAHGDTGQPGAGTSNAISPIAGQAEMALAPAQSPVEGDQGTAVGQTAEVLVPNQKPAARVQSVALGPAQPDPLLSFVLVVGLVLIVLPRMRKQKKRRLNRHT